MFKTKKKYFSRFKEPLLPLSNLVEVQMNSFENLLSHGLKEIFKEFSPINDYSGKKFSLEFIDFALDKPVNDEYYAKENKLTYDAPLKARVRLKNKLNKDSPQLYSNRSYKELFFPLNLLPLLTKIPRTLSARE